MGEYYYEPELEDLGPRLFLATIQWLDLVQAIFSFSESQLLSHLQNERFSETISRIVFSCNFLWILIKSSQEESNSLTSFSLANQSTSMFTRRVQSHAWLAQYGALN